MTEFIAVNTKKSTQLTKALVFNFFRNFLYFQLQESPQEPEIDKQNFTLKQFYQTISSQR